MGTTLEIGGDGLQAAKELARHSLATPAKKPEKSSGARSGVPVFASRGEVVTPQNTQNLMDQEGV